MQILKDFEKLKDKKQAANLQRFFKTGKGEYGEGDIFLGIKVPEQRKLAGKYKELDLEILQKLIQSPVHEHRLTALFILIYQFKMNPKEIFEFYIKNTQYVNNWDLVDLSAPNIVGKYLEDKPRDLLYKFSASENLWERRISVLSCFWFIKNKNFDDALKIAEILLNDKHDLIHKAVGWMLREIGKKNQEIEEEFLKKHYKTMPRTMLRYAIEKFSEEKKKFYMKKVKILNNL